MPVAGELATQLASAPLGFVDATSEISGLPPVLAEISDGSLQLASSRPFSIDVAREVGRERGRLRREGRSIGDFDLVIGCTARHLGIPVCTNNRRHFERIAGLEVISAP